MTLTMHEATVTPCVRALNSLAAILEKAIADASTRKIDTQVLLQTRLFPDMLPLAAQIFIANDIAGGGAARLAGVELPVFEARDKTLPELIVNTRKTVAFLEALQPAQFLGAEDKTVTWQTRSSTKNMQGTPYLFHHVLPNVFFHVATAYDILRQGGLVIGKADYLGT